MTEEILNNGNSDGQEPQQERNEGEQQFSADYVRKLRDEAAKWRTQLREVQAQLKELQPKAVEFEKLQEERKTEAERLAERLAALESDLQQKQQEAEAAQAQARLIRLAAQAGVDVEVASLLDISKLNLEDEEATLAILRKLGRGITAGGMANPGRTGANAQPTEEELRSFYFGGGRNRPTIFGG